MGSTDLASILSFGSLYFIFKNVNISSSFLGTKSILLPFFPDLYSDNPCSFNVYPNFNARNLITVLNALLPVKYNVANAYSSGDVYKKSNLRGVLSSNCPIVKLFVLPRVNTSTTTFSFTILSNNISNAFLLSSSFVIIISISPDDFAPRL